jgi:lethal(2) giant larvae protein
VRPVERQIEARNVMLDDGMGSMVRCLLLVKTYVISQSSNATATLWAGTNSGAIYVFSLNIQTGMFKLFFPICTMLCVCFCLIMYQKKINFCLIFLLVMF